MGCTWLVTWSHPPGPCAQPPSRGTCAFLHPTFPTSRGSWVEQRLQIHASLEPQTGTASGNMVFVGAKVKMRLPWSRVTLNLKTGVLVRQSRGRHGRREERLVTAEAEGSVMRPQARGQLGPPAAGRGGRPCSGLRRLLGPE